MIKPKLLIVVGAGASVDFGLPSVNSIETLFRKWAIEEFPLVDNPNESLYSFIANSIKVYCSQNTNNYLDSLTNFESILFAIQNLAALHSDKENNSFNSRINPFISLESLPKIKQFGDIVPANGHSLNFLHSRLVDKLLNHFRTICATLNEDKKELLLKQTLFFTELQKHYQIGFINLNYDNVILSSLPNFETGYSKITGEFERERLFTDDWEFCYHLHGSVHFDMVGGKETEMHKIFWNDDLNSIFSQNSSGRNFISTTEGLSHLNSNIIAGLDKSSQLLREPFGSYFMQLERLIYQADKVMFMGYGFSDAHINNFFPYIQYDKSKRRKTLIVGWASDEDGSLRYRHDKWSAGVFHTIPFNGFEMGDGKNKEPKPAIYFKKRGIFEKSSNPDYPLSVWYGGLSEAFNNVAKIIKELK